MLHVASGFVAVQRGEVMSDDQALAEGLVHADVQTSSEFGQTRSAAGACAVLSPWRSWSEGAGLRVLRGADDGLHR